MQKVCVQLEMSLNTLNKEITMQAKYPQVGFRISPELLEKLTEEAKRQERSSSQIVRFAIEAYLANNQTQK